jgi:hypothetical protein
MQGEQSATGETVFSVPDGYYTFQALHQKGNR